MNTIEKHGQVVELFYIEYRLQSTDLFQKKTATKLWGEMQPRFDAENASLDNRPLAANADLRRLQPLQRVVHLL